MSHYAKIENDIVVQVIKASYSFITSQPGEWVRTSYNMKGGIHKRGLKPLRKNYAGVGYTYNRELDAFIPPKPFDDWILNEEKGLWEPAIPLPDDNNTYTWIDGNWKLEEDS